MPTALGIVASAYTVVPPFAATGLLMWYDADDTNSFALSGVIVAQWRDKSGNGRHLIPNAGNVYRSADVIKVGRSNVDFAGTSSLRGPTGRGTVAQKPFSVFGVVRHHGTAAYRAIIGSIANAALELRLSNVHKMSVMSQYTTEIGAGTAVYPTNAACVFGVTFSAAGVWACRLNSAADGGGTNNVAYAPASDTMQVGDALGEPLTGNIGELIKWDRVLTGPEITTVESYLTTKWK